MRCTNGYLFAIESRKMRHPQRNDTNFAPQQIFRFSKKWCLGADSNHRHADFQSAALPTELPRPNRSLKAKGPAFGRRTGRRALRPPCDTGRRKAAVYR